MIRSICLALTLWLISLLVLSSCENLRNEVDPDRLNIDASASKLVVTCFLSPQDLVLAAKVARTKTILGDQQTANDNVVDATVSLSDGNRSIILRYDARQGYYRADSKQLPVIAGRTYSLAVQTPAKEQVTSSCTIPGPVNLAGTTFDSLADTESGRPVQRYFVRARWQDPVGQTNFYQITGLFRYVVNPQQVPQQPVNQTPEEATYLQFDNSEGTLLSDHSLGGRPMISQPAYLTASSDSLQQSGFKNQFKAATVVINLLNTDRSYYLYQDAVIRQAETKGNPFAEPVPLPNNIRGGLGCFGAYNRSTLMVRLK